MNNFNKFSVLLVVIVFFSSGAVSSFEYKDVLRVRDGRVISFGEMMGELNNADMVFVGEDHDNEKHHRAQLDVIRDLKQKGVPLGIGLEMFRADSQAALNQWIKGDIKPDKFINVYYDNWNLPWPLYKSIFLYSREKNIPMIGLNLPERISRKVSKEGFKSLSPADMKELPQGITCDVDRDYMEFIRKAHGGHGGSEKSFVNFCEAQMVWDKTMALRLIEYKKRSPGTTIVVLAGAGHTWKHGIPAQIKKTSKYTSITILPDVPGKVHRSEITLSDADYVLLE